MCETNRAGRPDGWMTALSTRAALNVEEEERNAIAMAESMCGSQDGLRMVPGKEGKAS